MKNAVIVKVEKANGNGYAVYYEDGIGKRIEPSPSGD